jgi:formate--tetrahydrofolate ligase
MEKFKEMIDKFNILAPSMEPFGKNIYKINPQFYQAQKPDGKLVILTSINPTTHGEGKTTCAIGLADGLNAIGKKAILALREPSMGPVFGRKGTATGGGECLLEPNEKINLHFTGDLHAITGANNLIAAVIDSHLYWGNALNIDLATINWPRCLDVNDRALRTAEIKIKKDLSRTTNFVITAASKMMAILSLASDEADLRVRLNETMFALDNQGNPLYLKQLDVVGSVMATLSDAIKPNLVATKYLSPALIHCGPFANIATGTNSMIATKLAKRIGEIVISETGFASELGYEKFVDVVSQQHGIMPDCVGLVVTVRALKEHSDFESDFTLLDKHIKNVTKTSSNMIVIVNVFADDSVEDVQKLCAYLETRKVPFAKNTSYVDGPKGATELAKKVVAILENKNVFKSPVANVVGIENKIKTIAKEFYYVDDVEFTNEAKNQIAMIKKIDQKIYENWPIIIAKSPITIDGNDKKIENYVLKISQLELNTGAKFVLAFTNQVIMLPGLPKDGNYININLENDQIKNLK